MPLLNRLAIAVCRRWRPSAEMPPEPWPLDQPLMRWSDQGDVHTTRSACEGTLVLAGSGAGKTSAVGRELALAYLKQGGFGFCVFCVKKDEPEWWLSLAEEAGRKDDVILFGHPDHSPWRFNVLDYEVTRSGLGAGITENIANIVAGLHDVLDRQGGTGGGNNERFWRANDKLLLRNAVDLLLLAGVRLTIDQLREVVMSAPTSKAQAASLKWRERSSCWKWLERADERSLTPEQRHDLGVVADYWLRVFPETTEKTRSIFVTSFTATVDLLGRSMLRTLFCTDTNITPEAAQAGKIIVISLPTKEFGDTGLIAAMLWKQAMARSLERRDVKQSPRPVCLWMDEAAQLVTSSGGDMLFASSCRSSRTALVLMGHNIGQFHVAFGGGERGRAETDGLFSLMNLKVFGAGSDFESCTWASNLIGKERKMFFSAGSNAQPTDWLGALTGLGQGPTANAGMNEQMHYSVEPTAFSTLRTGGPENKRCVDSIIVQSGRVFKKTGTTWMPFVWHQKAQ